jgi:hypothetical protein
MQVLGWKMGGLLMTSLFHDGNNSIFVVLLYLSLFQNSFVLEYYCQLTKR